MMTHTQQSDLGKRLLLLLATAGMIAPWAVAAPEAGTYTLYRNSVTDAGMRLHIATFDALDGAGYNRENCDQARRLYAAQPGVKVLFWCEPGRFRTAAGDQAQGPSKQFTTGKTEERTCSPSAAKLARGDTSDAKSGYACPK